MKKIIQSKLLLPLIMIMASCSDVRDPEKLESEVFVAPWAVGEWQFENEKGEKTTVTLYRDGSAIGSDDSIGNWFFVEKYLYITWMSGWMDMIDKKNGHFEKHGYAPGVPPDSTPSNQSVATKIQKTVVK